MTQHANGSLIVFQVFSVEKYDHARMYELRQNAIERATSAKCIGIVLGILSALSAWLRPPDNIGTLGRQGNPKVLSYLQESLTSAGIAHVVVLLSEIFPDKLKKFAGVDAWIQVRDHVKHLIQRTYEARRLHVRDCRSTGGTRLRRRCSTRTRPPWL